MKRRLSRALLIVLFAVTGLGARSGFGHEETQAKPVAGGQERGVLLVELARPLNSKNLRAGSVVEARVPVRQNGMSIPPGSKVIGHVEEAKARSKGDSGASVKVVFDTINPPGSAKPTPIAGLIKAVAPNPNSGIDTGGVGYTGLIGSTSATTGPSTAPSSTPLLNEQSAGVNGIPNLELNADGLLTSSSKEVKLESGTQLLLDVTVQ